MQRTTENYFSLLLLIDAFGAARWSRMCWDFTKMLSRAVSSHVVFKHKKQDWTTCLSLNSSASSCNYFSCCNTSSVEDIMATLLSFAWIARMKIWSFKSSCSGKTAVVGHVVCCYAFSADNGSHMDEHLSLWQVLSLIRPAVAWEHLLVSEPTA